MLQVGCPWKQKEEGRSPSTSCLHIAPITTHGYVSADLVPAVQAHRERHGIAARNERLLNCKPTYERVRIADGSSIGLYVAVRGAQEWFHNTVEKVSHSINPPF